MKTLLIFIVLFFTAMNIYPQDTAGKEDIAQSLSLVPGWVLNNMSAETRLLEYKYYPSKDIYSKENNHIRQLAMLWVLTKLRNFLKTDSLDGLIQRTLDYYLKYKHNEDDSAFLIIDGKAPLAANAFIIMALINYDYPDKENLLGQFAGGILEAQNKNGSFITDFTLGGNKGINYYPGEALLSLMKLYGATKDERYLKSVQRAYHYYKNYWRINKNTAFIPWHTQAYLLLYRQIKDDNVAEFIFEMNDWIIDNYQILKGGDPRFLGAFPKNNPRCGTTSVYLEGINDAYSLALERKDKFHINKYIGSVNLGTAFLLNMQVTKENSGDFSNPRRAIGGFRQSYTDDSQRTDYTQHAVNALMKAYRNR